MAIAKAFGKVLRVNEFENSYTTKDGQKVTRKYSVALVLDGDDVGRVLLREKSEIKAGQVLEGIPVRAGHLFIRNRGVDVLIEAEG